MKAKREQLFRNYRQRARAQIREIAVTAVLTIVALGFILIAALAPVPQKPHQTGSLPERPAAKP